MRKFHEAAGNSYEVDSLAHVIQELEDTLKQTSIRHV